MRHGAKQYKVTGNALPNYNYWLPDAPAAANFGLALCPFLLLFRWHKTMQFITTPIAGLFEIELSVIRDERGWFTRTYSKEEFTRIGHTKEWVQANHSFTKAAGAIRGLHYQHPPHAEAKLVRCINGRVLDVAVDLRRNSPTFLCWHALELSAENRKSFYIPEGCAHGFQTLTEDCALVYFHTANYTPAAEAGIRYDDTALGIHWPMPPTDVSARDLNHPPIPPTFEGLLL